MGYGDVMPTNDAERALAAALALAGAALFGLIVGAIRGLVARRRPPARSRLFSMLLDGSRCFSLLRDASRCSSSHAASPPLSRPWL